MKIPLFHILAIFSIVICLPTLQAQQVEPQHFEDVKAVQLLSKLPAGPQVNVLRNYSSLQLLKLYDTLLDIKKEIPANIAQENKAFKEAFINTESEFKGDEILSSIQTAAGYKVGRILGCTLKEMNNGTCQPLKYSNDPEITPDEKAAMPFAETTESWTRDWVHLLPIVEIFDEKSDLLREDFFKDVSMDNVFQPNMPLLSFTALNERKKAALNILKRWKIYLLKTISRVDNNIQDYFLKIDQNFDQKPYFIAKYFQAGNTPQILDHMYLLTFPQSLQDTMLAHFKLMGYGSWDAFIPGLAHNFSPYVKYQMDRFLKRDAHLHLKNHDRIERLLFNLTQENLFLFTYDNTPRTLKAVWEHWKNKKMKEYRENKVNPYFGHI